MPCAGGGSIRNGSTAQMLPVPKMMTAGMLEMTGYDNEQQPHLCYGDNPTLSTLLQSLQSLGKTRHNRLKIMCFSNNL